MDKRRLILLDKIINTKYKNTTGIVVLKNNETVYEKYYNKYSSKDTVHIASVTKSIFSILIGIAIDQGKIKSLDEKVLDFFPEYCISEGENTIQNVTIKNLMTMTAPYKYNKENYEEYFSSDSYVKATLDLLGGKGRIGEFRYTPIIGPDILAGILVKVTGQSVLDFANKNLFLPLGIQVDKSIVFKTKEEQIAFYKEKTSSGWVSDPKGINTVGWGLNLTTIDMAKIGKLYLNNGIWDNKKIVSSQWISDSTKKYSQWRKLGYGYLWWIINEKEESFAALGDGGNVIYVNKRKNIVVASTATFLPKANDRIKLIKEYIEPIF